MNTFKIDSTINNRYQILSVLGQGGMATAYKALDKERGLAVALKALNADQLREPRRKERFLREFTILSRLSHPNIVKVLEQGETESGAPFFSMECLSGQSLADKLKEVYSEASSSLDIAESILILEEIAKALNYIHSQSIVYCDLKPANVMLLKSAEADADKGPKIKLIDFGISRLLDNSGTEETGKMVGTSYYMSPEQIRDEALDARSDIYSFGVMAFELFTGNVPFNHQALFTVTASHLIGKVPSIRDMKREMPKSIDRMIQICMEKNKENRYESMEDIFERLEAARQQLHKPSLFKRVFGRLK